MSRKVSKALSFEPPPKKLDLLEGDANNIIIIFGDYDDDIIQKFV